MRRKELKKDKNMFVVEYEFNSAETSDLLRKIGSNFMREDDEGDNNVVIDILMNAIPFEIEFWEAPIFQPEILDLKFIGDKLKVKLEVHLPPKMTFPTNYKGIKLKIPDKEKELEFIKELLIKETLLPFSYLEKVEGDEVIEHFDRVEVEIEYGRTRKRRMMLDIYKCKEKYCRRLEGKKVGEEIEFEDEDGKFYKVSVISLYKRKFPELTEEIVRKLNIRIEPKTKENYIRVINKAAKEILIEKFRKELMEQVLDWFVKNSKVEISERMLHRLIERNFKGYDYNEARLEVLRDLVKERMVKFVSEREGIEVLEEDIKEAEDILKGSGIPEEVIDILNVNYDKPDFLKRIVLERKVFDFIIEHANIV